MTAIAEIGADPAAHSARATPARAAVTRGAGGGIRLWWGATAGKTSGPPGQVLSGSCRSLSRAIVISVGQSLGVLGWVAQPPSGTV